MHSLESFCIFVLRNRTRNNVPQNTYISLVDKPLSKVSTMKTVKIISQQQVDLNNLIVKIVSIVLNEILESSEKNSMTVEYGKNSVTIKHNEENDYVFDGKHFLRNGVTEKDIVLRFMFELSYAMATGKIVKEDISILSDNNSELLVVGLFLNYFNNAKNYKLHYSEVDNNIIGITFKNLSYIAAL